MMLPLSAEAQFSNLRERVLDARNPIQTLDSLTVAVPLISVTDLFSGQKTDPRFFKLENNRLRTDTAALRLALPNCSKILVCYRIFPFDLGAKISRLDTIAIRRRLNADAIEFDYEPYQPSKPLWEQSGLSSSGAYTRGLSFGNSQNLVFNSNLNLQLNGKLGNDLELTAALSDNTIPLQPDGTTRQLQEFDRIFIQLKRKNATLTAGDFDLTRPAGYFSNYFKRLQGAMVTVESLKLKVSPSFGKPTAGKKAQKPASTNIPLSQYPNIRLRSAAAISRGKFARQIIQGQEGNQGPYRLQGAEGERFIIVLAGTEKVFADGQLLRRGQEDDYTVDYNLGELSFTPRRLITKDIRIIVEFEYAVQTYLRSTVAANASWQMPRAKLFFNLYSEQDSRNNGGAQELSLTERSRLAQVGDDLQNAYAPGIDTLDAFDPARVLYSLEDTMLCGQPRQVLRYSTHPDSARYAARFTEVSSGQGNYVLAKTAANGRVFRWSPPDPITCQPTGNFEPIVRLVAPETRQLYALGGDFQPFKNSKLQAEIALSTRDLNRFSPLGNADNVGAAGVVGWRQDFGFGKREMGGMAFRPSGVAPFTALDSNALRGVNAPFPDGLKAMPPRSYRGTFFANYEFAARDFRPLNPYRPAEFVRDWNIGISQDTTAEHLAKAGISLEKNRLGEVRYEFGAFRREGFYEGARHSGGWRLQRAGWGFAGEANLLQTNGQTERTRFSRPKADFSKTFFAKNDSASQRVLFKVGLYGEREKNARRAAQADTLSGVSFWYDLLRVYFQTPENQGAWQFGGHLSQRNDYAPAGDLFQQNTEARDFNLNGSWNNAARRIHHSTNHHSTNPPITNPPITKNHSTNHQLTWVLTLRRLRILAPELTNEEPQNTYLGRADYSLTAWKNALGFTTGYELGSGQSPRIEFNYLAVNPGEGNFSWIDRNQDSILQVDEMEIAVFQDQANYVRVAVTTPDYVRTNNVALNQTLRLEPRLLWPTAKRGWRKRVGRLSTQSTLQINRRTFAGAGGVRAWDPFQTSVADTALATLSSTIRNILFINRAQPDWDASISAGDNRSQLALTTGFEQRRASDYALHLRANLSRRWSAEADFVNSLKSSENQAFVSRNYQIEGWELGPKITWLPIRGFRMVANMKWETSRNTLPAAERADQTNWTAELTWNPASKANAQGFKAATSLRLKGTFADVRYTGAPNSAVAFAMLEGLQDGKNFLWNLTLDRQLSKSMQLSLNYEGRKTGVNRVVHVARAQVRAVF